MGSLEITFVQCLVFSSLIVAVDPVAVCFSTAVCHLKFFLKLLLLLNADNYDETIESVLAADFLLKLR
jgi:hypothetical protein